MSLTARKRPDFLSSDISPTLALHLRYVPCFPVGGTCIASPCSPPPPERRGQREYIGYYPNYPEIYDRGAIRFLCFNGEPDVSLCSVMPELRSGRIAGGGSRGSGIRALKLHLVIIIIS